MRRVIAAMDALNRAMSAVCHVLLAAIVFVTVMQVFLRFALSRPVSWSEELALLLLIWYGMLAVAVGVWRHGHIAIATFRDALPLWGAVSLDAFAQLLVLGFAAVVFFNSFDLVGLVGVQVMPALGFSKAWLYYPACFGSGLMALNAFANLALRRFAAPSEGSTA